MLDRGHLTSSVCEHQKNKLPRIQLPLKFGCLMPHFLGRAVPHLHFKYFDYFIIKIINLMKKYVSITITANAKKCYIQ